MKQRTSYEDMGVESKRYNDALRLIPELTKPSGLNLTIDDGLDRAYILILDELPIEISMSIEAKVNRQNMISRAGIKINAPREHLVLRLGDLRKYGSGSLMQKIALDNPKSKISQDEYNELSEIIRRKRKNDKSIS